MGTLSEATGGAGGNSNNPGAKDQNIYENRASTKKIIRVVTVIAYLFSVSFVAIVLSAYYVFLWQPPNSRLVHRAHTMDKKQAEYLSDNLPHEFPLDDNINNNYYNRNNNNNNNNKKNVGEIFGSINNLRSRLIRFHNIDKIENNNNNNYKSNVKNNNQKYVKAINITKLRNPIVEKIYHESDKVTTSDLQTSIYGISNKHLDVSIDDDEKTTDKSTVFTKIENTISETTVSLTPPTEISKYYEEDKNTSTLTLTSTSTSKIEFQNDILENNRHELENHNLNTQITTDKSDYQTTENLYFQELHDDKTSSNGTEFINKLKSMYTTTNDKENLQDPMKVETTVELTSTTDSLISIVQEETSKSYDVDIDQSVLPER